ncbi:hypothetical protein JJB09_23965 [Rhizobium sp. KVB221]|uniref:Transmembrane anchored protein n=1 Tax=Rhizobium setariae TaxID=2801340 RepID=A0A936YQS6_9HYPH|nr:hypothetical protein [Rhizobium setariae]MBL0375074.1 hypothetical protein [Rhizobium setariae]
MVEKHDTHSSLLTNHFLLKVTAIIGLLAALTAAITVAGKYYGDRLAMDGQTEIQAPVRIAIGQDILSLPANMIRFENQRRNGRADSVSLYAAWPELEGYTRAKAALFSAPGGSRNLIFMEFTQSVMSRDMSGRLEPIYRRLFTGTPEKGPAGLSINRLSEKSGFGPEVILTAKQPDGRDYVVRCILPATAEAATSADCQRDIHVGRDLTFLYRFSSQLLPEWQELDAALGRFAVDHVKTNQIQK